MTKRLADNIKRLREAKNVSQERMAQALNVSYQAVSKWETGKSLPDITLLPQISRYFGITIDALLMAEQLDEKLLFEQYETEAERLSREGKVAENIPLWREALKKMPNNPYVKEMLMAAYFDTDVVGYSKEIVELGSEIYRDSGDSYCRGSAVCLVARTYAAVGNTDKAKGWAKKTHSIIHAKEFLDVEIGEEPDEMQRDFCFATNLFLNRLFYMVVKIGAATDEDEAKEMYKMVAAMYEATYSLLDADEDVLEKQRILQTLIEE